MGETGGVLRECLRVWVRVCVCWVGVGETGGVLGECLWVWMLGHVCCCICSHVRMCRGGHASEKAASLPPPQRRGRR